MVRIWFEIRHRRFERAGVHLRLGFLFYRSKLCLAKIFFNIIIIFILIIIVTLEAGRILELSIEDTPLFFNLIVAAMVLKFMNTISTGGKQVRSIERYCINMIVFVENPFSWDFTA